MVVVVADVVDFRALEAILSVQDFQSILVCEEQGNFLRLVLQAWIE